jgi:hypothetical protein
VTSSSIARTPIGPNDAAAARSRSRSSTFHASMNSPANCSGPTTCCTTKSRPATSSRLRSERHSGESRPRCTAPGTRPTIALVVTMNATGISAATSWSAIPTGTIRPAYG